MDKDYIADSLLTVFESINKKRFIEKVRFNFKGENLLLALLMELGGKATPGELMNYADFTAARLTAISKKLESKGFVIRKQNAEDKRSTIIELTSEGIEQFMKIKEEIMKNVLNLVEKLGERDAKEFLRLMNRLAEISAQADFNEAVVKA